ncbi:MAG: FAD-binding oxidoreductase [Proteobacteria bacterium]|nr:FAD-binding oxidoreductase [Pseudomonadota bacterium]MBI3499802.1 FAD-binding oxidoreductase [Pseudomonadota bacterium]
MAESFDFVVVGAGISGASTAYHLKRRGVPKVLLIERASPASGGTGKSAAIVRQHYSSPILVRLARESIDLFKAMPEELGQSGGYVNSGYCFLIAADMLEGARRNIAMQRTLGIDTVLVEGAGFPQHLPELNPEGVAATVFETLGGYADPVKSTEAYVAGFQRLGGSFRPRTPVRSLLSEGPSITGIVTDKGKIAAGTVVNAAGPWAKPLAASAGLALELRAVLEQDTVWQVPPGRPVPSVSISNGVDATYLRPLGDRRFVIGRGFPKEYADVDPYNYKETGDEAFIADVQSRIEKRFPAFAGMRLIDAYGALYDVSPDWYPFVGTRAGLAGYADASGGSGHGFKIGPALGRGLANWLVDGDAPQDFKALSHDRLASGRLFVGSFGGNRG